MCIYICMAVVSFAAAVYFVGGQSYCPCYYPFLGIAYWLLRSAYRLLLTPAPTTSHSLALPSTSAAPPSGGPDDSK